MPAILKEGLFFFHTWCAAGAIHYWDIILEKKLILITSVAVWGSKQHNSEGKIRGKRHSWLCGFPKTRYYGEHPLQGARCWCWWWSWWWWWSLWSSWRWSCSWCDGRFGWWFITMKKYGFSIFVFFENECVICIQWKSTDAKFRFLGSDCQDLQRHQPLCRSSSRCLCCTRVQLKISTIVSFLLFRGIDDVDDFSHRSGRRPILSRRTYQVPSSTQTTGDSLWRNWNLRMEVLKKADPCNWDYF